MEALKQELDQAYKLVSALRVEGDAVDVVSGIRAHLRRAWTLAGTIYSKTRTNDGKTGTEGDHG